MMMHDAEGMFDAITTSAAHTGFDTALGKKCGLADV